MLCKLQYDGWIIICGFLFGFWSCFYSLVVVILEGLVLLDLPRIHSCYTNGSCLPTLEALLVLVDPRELLPLS